MGHGHVIPNADGSKTRCCGPKVCPVCAAELAQLSSAPSGVTKTVSIKNKQPLQPLYKTETGSIRFKENAIVRFLLDAGPFSMNTLAAMPFSNDDREQFAQLIGYSLWGFGELSYVSDKTYNRALRNALNLKD